MVVGLASQQLVLSVAKAAPAVAQAAPAHFPAGFLYCWPVPHQSAVVGQAARALQHAVLAASPAESAVAAAAAHGFPESFVLADPVHLPAVAPVPLRTNPSPQA